MNIKHLLTASILAAIGSAAFAQQAMTHEATTPILSRAQVASDVLKARAQGTLLPAGEAGPVAVPARSTLTRAAVVQDLAMARADGELLPAGEIGAVVDKPTGPSRSREEVRQEARSADQLSANPLYAGGA